MWLLLHSSTGRDRLWLATGRGVGGQFMRVSMGSGLSHERKGRGCSNTVLLVQIHTLSGHCNVRGQSRALHQSRLPAKPTLEHLFTNESRHPSSILHNHSIHHFLIPFPISSVAVCPSPYPKFFISSGAIRPLSMRQLR